MDQGHLLHQLNAWVQDQHLPATYAEDVTRFILPLFPDMHAQMRAANEVKGAWVLGINGAQGSGKSTLAALLVHLFRNYYGLRVAQCSLDDLYMTRTQRQDQARTVHPLLATRGVPGTHDLDLWWRLLAQASQSAPVSIPSFDKSIDDRLPAEQWPQVGGPLQVIILEGWCVGCRPQPAALLLDPINELEAQEDPDAVWRQYVNAQLEERYQRVFASLDTLLMLQPPNFDAVLRWRGQQEQRLASLRHGDGIMDEDQLQRFIQHYERLTRWQWHDLVGHADYHVLLDDNQRMIDVLQPR